MEIVCGTLTGAYEHCARAGAGARLEGVNRPDLLPKESTPLIDVAGFLTPGEVSQSRGPAGAMYAASRFPLERLSHPCRRTA